MTAPAEIPVGTEADAHASQRSGAGRIDWDAHRAFRRRGLAWGTLAAAGLGLVYVAVLTSGDLAELDLAKLLALEVDGSTLQPTAASSLRGHHARAEVSFAVGARPERFALTLGAVRNVGPQRLEWP